MRANASAAVTELLGLSKDASRAEITQEAKEADAALRSFQTLFPLVDGDGLASYLNNLADRAAEQQADLDECRDILRAIRTAVERPPFADDIRSAAQQRTVPTTPEQP